MASEHETTTEEYLSDILTVLEGIEKVLNDIHTAVTEVR